MKIGILTNSYPPNLNGVSNAVYNLEMALKKAGAEVYIVTPRVPKVIYADNILPIYSAPAPKHASKDLRVPINIGNKVYKFFLDKKVEILHSHDTIMGGFDTIALAHKLEIPCVHTYHTLLEEYEYFNFPGYKQSIRSISQLICDGHTATIALSSKIKHYLLNIGVSKEIISLPNIIDLSFTKDDEKERKVNEFLYNNSLLETKNLITFGRVAKEKNLKFAIDKFIKFLDKNEAYKEKIRYIIAGDGPELNNLKEYAKNYHPYITFFGKYCRDDLQYLLRPQDTFLITSFTEVLPTTPLEAMFFGLPVICINDSAYDYLIKDNINGLICTDENLIQKLEYLFDSQDLHAKLSKQSRIDAQSYLQQDVASQYIDTYQRLINNYSKESIIKSFLLNGLDRYKLMIKKLSRNRF
jgi:1,2-diacylglycerol 3-alpha-glucosyltransferase